MKMYIYKFQFESFNELFGNSVFDSIVYKNKSKAIRSAKKFKKYLEKDCPNISTKYTVYEMTIKKVK